MRTSFILSGLVLLFSLCAYSDDRALVITIGLYENGIAPLGGPNQDAVLIQNLLINELNYTSRQVKVISNGRAKRQELLNQIRHWLVDQTNTGDRVFLYYSGHGAQVKDLNRDEYDGLDEVLVPVDAYIKDKALHNVITDDEIHTVLSELRDRKVTLVIDACFSGTITRSAGFSIDTDDNVSRTFSNYRNGLEELNLIEKNALIRNFRKEPSFLDTMDNLVVWTAVSQFQAALDDIEMQPRSGAFTNRFVRAIRNGLGDRDGDRIVTHSELVDWLRHESESYCDRNKRICRTGLTPTIEASPILMGESVVTFLKGAERVDDIKLENTLLTSLGINSSEQNQSVSIELFLTEDASRKPKQEFKTGDSIVVRVNSNQEGYITLLDLDSKSGAITQIFPYNKKQLFSSEKDDQCVQPVSDEAQAFLKAGSIFNFPATNDPFRYVVGENKGKHFIAAIVTQDPIDLTMALMDGMGFKNIQNPKEYLGKIASLLRNPWVCDDKNRSSKWDASVVFYQVEN